MSTAAPILPCSRLIRRLTAALLLLGAALVAFLLLIFIANPPLSQISEQVNDATIIFALDRSQVLFPSECVQAAWSVDGIRAVYINDEATVGSGTREICPWAMQPALRVVFQDDREQIYSLPVRVLTYTPLVWALLVVIAVCLGGAFALTRQAPAGERGRDFRQQPAALWRGLLRRPLLVVSMITATGAALRLAQLGDLSLVLDEAAIWQFTHDSLSETLQNNASGNSAPPLFALLLFLWQLGGQSETWLRLLPAFASIAAITALYGLARRLFDRNAGYAAALLIALAAPQIGYAQYLREYSLAVLLAILALYALLKLREPKARLGWVGIWMVCLLTQYGLLLLVAALDLLWTIAVARKPERRSVIRWLGAQVVLALTLAVVYFAALRFQLGGGSADTWYRLFYWDGLSASLGDYVFGGFGGLLTLSFGESAALLSFGALAAVGLALLVRRRELIPLLFLPILVALVAGILGYYPYTGSRQMTFVTPLFLLAAAGGFSYLVGLRDQLPLRLLAAAAMIAGVSGGLVGINAFYARPGFDQVRPVVETLAAARWEADEVLLIPPYTYPLLNYYYLAEDRTREATFTLAVGDNPTAYGAQLDALRARSERVWVVLQCCDEGLRQYLEARGESTPAPFVTSGNVSLYLLES